MKNRGFTLIELLAVIVILGVILVIAIPSISAAILNSRKNAYVATANEFVDGARLITLNDPSRLPSTGTSTILISEIKLEKGSSIKSPFGKTYTLDSGVYITYDAANQEYIYSIYLMDDGGNGIGTKTVSGGTTTINAVDIKTVTKGSVAVGGNTPTEPEPEPEPTYVSSGMLVWLDGIDNNGIGQHSTTTTTWTDLSDNNNSPTLAAGGTVTWNANNFSFNGGASSVFNFPATLNSFELAGNWTVEIRLSRSTNSTLDVIFGNHNGSKGFAIFHRANSNTYEIFNGFEASPYYYYSSNATVTTGVATTISVTYTPGTFKFYQNGELKNTVSATLLVSAGTNYPQGLGSYGNCNNSVYSFGGNIYSLRIYNKVLSDTEIAGNYAIDLTRF